MRSIACTVILVAMMLGSVGPAVTAEEKGSAPRSDVPNVLITFTVGRIDAGGNVPLKSYQLLAPGNGERVEMMTGARVPIPVDRATAEQPATSFSYQNVGFTAAVEALVLPDGKIQLAGNIEDSSLAGPVPSGGGPIIQTLDQRVVAVLDDGVPLRINSVEETETRSLYIEIEADTQDETGRRKARKR